MIGTFFIINNLGFNPHTRIGCDTGVGEAIHDYLKNSAIAEWYMVTNKADAEQYIALAQRSLLSIQQAVSKRSRPKRPTD